MSRINAWLITIPAGYFLVVPGTQLLIALVAIQLTFNSLLCTASDNSGVATVGALMWLAFAASLPLGFAATVFRRLRFGYLILLSMLPVALSAQQMLLDRKFLYCNWV